MRPRSRWKPRGRFKLGELTRRGDTWDLPAACRLDLQMTTDIDIDIERSAHALIQQYGDDAKLEAAVRADQFLEDGDWLGDLVWQRILEAVERLQAQLPRAGQPVH